MPGKCRALHSERRIQKHKLNIGNNRLTVRAAGTDQGRRNCMLFVIILLRCVNRYIMWRTWRGKVWPWFNGVLPRPLIDALSRFERWALRKREENRRGNNCRVLERELKSVSPHRRETGAARVPARRAAGNQFHLQENRWHDERCF